MKSICLAIGLALSTAMGSAHALEVRFVESAPKDRFVVNNTEACELRDVVIELDLTSTRGGLIFDTTANGPGVEVFQPFEVRSGDVQLESSASVVDGASKLVIRIGVLPANQQASFTIDVDDTLTNSELGQIRVAGSEMENGRVTLEGSLVGTHTASFDANSLAVFTSPVCS